MFGGVCVLEALDLQENPNARLPIPRALMNSRLPQTLCFNVPSVDLFIPYKINL
jgi:hypothetical protein